MVRRKQVMHAQDRRGRNRKELRATMMSLLYVLGFCLLIGFAVYILGFTAFLVLS